MFLLDSLSGITTPGFNQKESLFSVSKDKRSQISDYFITLSIVMIRKLHLPLSISLRAKESARVR
jgi:hypothetical protein